MNRNRKSRRTTRKIELLLRKYYPHVYYVIGYSIRVHKSYRDGALVTGCNTVKYYVSWNNYDTNRYRGVVANPTTNGPSSLKHVLIIYELDEHSVWAAWRARVYISAMIIAGGKYFAELKKTNEFENGRLERGTCDDNVILRFRRFRTFAVRVY